MIAPLDVIAQSIRDAIAPVFLLGAVATVLSVTTARFSRIVDRYRTLMESNPKTEEILTEMDIMHRRSQLINASIALCTVCALLVCFVIAVMFVATEMNFAPGRIIAFLFIASMVTLVAGLILFLCEIHVSARTLTLLGKMQAAHKKKPKEQA